MDWIQNESAFTFVEMLLVLTILIITLPFIPFLYQQMQYQVDHEHISVQQFFTFVQNDAFNSETCYTDESKIYFVLDDGRTAVLETYKDGIRRRIDGKGHEMYLNDVASFEIKTLQYGLQINVVTSKGDAYEKTIVVASK